MRIIAGTQKGRRLHGPKGPGLRPTAGRVKEALFSILGNQVVGARFLDLYAGTGAIGIEALSRGARHVTFVESNPNVLRILRANVTQCRLGTAAEIQTCPACAFLKRHAKTAAQHDIIFADPPYQQDHLADLWTALAGTATIAPGALIVLEHSSKSAVPSANGRLSLLRQYRYGDTTLSVFEVSTQDTLAL